MALEPHTESVGIEPQLCQFKATNVTKTKTRKCSNCNKAVGWRLTPRHLAIGFLLICFGISASWQYKQGEFPIQSALSEIAFFPQKPLI